MNLVIVESPSKAKTINKYLGKDYHVLASFGHVRDLPAKNGSVDTANDFAMTYEVDSGSQKHVNELAKAAKGCDAIYLATDPDREGEAISWHVLEVLQQKKAIKKDAQVFRVVFHEITKGAVTKAIANPRDIDMNLVNAQQARRALDYLVGFSLSPVLWRKLPGSKSAGRVQSVALRLICEREAEIEAFISQEYWDVSAIMQAEGKAGIKAKLTHWQGKKLDKFDIANAEQAGSIEMALKSKTYAVSHVEPKTVKRNPSAPFTTSTLQQEASRKLGFGAKKTMQLAQKLYEGIPLEGGETTGLITYMRTDSVHLSGEAIAGSRAAIEKSFGKEYVPDSPRQYTSKAKNAQEAHEAIRPTDPTRKPEFVAKVLDKDMLRLYELIWKRTIASQMASALLDQVAMDFAANDNSAILRATGSTIKFDGFLRLYREGQDDQNDDADDEDKILPNLSVGTATEAKDVTAAQHFTEPPPRFSEASLVKKLEELGIGRPSTYASILSVLQDRNYVVLDRKRFIPEARGRLVSAFLVSFFERYVQPEFTARIEERLDNVSNGEIDWKEVLRDFWGRFNKSIEDSKEIRMSEVLEILDKELEPFIFAASKDGEGKDPRACPVCSEGRLSLRLGRYGAYVACSRYPDCTYTREVSGSAADGESNTDSAAAGDLPKVLGNHPRTGQEVWLKKGPYGIYVEVNDGGDKPKRASLLKGMEPDSMTLDMAVSLLELPRELGAHPDTHKPILAGVGRYGPYLLHDGKYTTLKGDDDVMTVGINRAVTILAESKKPASAEPLRNLGKHPADGSDINIYDGRYGPYVKYGKINASLPRGAEVDAYTLEEALALIEKKAGAKGGAKKAPAKKTAAPKKKAAKKK
jgi:DNA topoisomerase I